MAAQLGEPLQSGIYSAAVQLKNDISKIFLSNWSVHLGYWLLGGV